MQVLEDGRGGEGCRLQDEADGLRLLGQAAEGRVRAGDVSILSILVLFKVGEGGNGGLAELYGRCVFG